jgi:hypothetical protein
MFQPSSLKIAVQELIFQQFTTEDLPLGTADSDWPVFPNYYLTNTGTLPETCGHR